MSDKFCEAFQAFKTKLDQIKKRRNTLGGEIRVLRAEIKTLQKDFSQVQGLGETIQAQQLKVTLDDKLRRLNDLESQLDGIGRDADLRGLKKAAARNPDSEIHQLALAVAEAAPMAVAEKEEAFNKAAQALQDARAAYLQAVEKLGEAHRGLTTTFNQAKAASAFLPQEKQARVPEPPAVRMNQLRFGETKLRLQFGAHVI